MSELIALADIFNVDFNAFFVNPKKQKHPTVEIVRKRTIPTAGCFIYVMITLVILLCSRLSFHPFYLSTPNSKFHIYYTINFLNHFGMAFPYF